MSRDRHSPKLLTSWKEIADYLRIAVRTAQLWEHVNGLPIHRMPGEKGRVAADPDELDQWRQSVCRTGQRSSSSVCLKTYAALTVILMAGVVCLSITLIGQRREGQAAGFQTIGECQRVADYRESTPLGEGLQELTVADGRPDVAQLLSSKVTFADVDGDNSLETILHFGASDSPTHLSPLSDSSKRNNELRSCATVVTGPETTQGHRITKNLNNHWVTAGDGSFQQNRCLLESRSPAKGFECSGVSNEISDNTFNSYLECLTRVRSGVRPICAHCEHKANSQAD